MRICCLFPKRLYETKTSPARRDYVEAVRRADGVELALTGQGWPEWDDARPAVENVERIAGSSVDVVWWYKWQGTSKDNVPPIVEPAEVSRRWVTVECFNECYWPDDLVVKQVLESRTRVVIAHHANDAQRFVMAWDGWPLKVRHVPHCADPNVFKQPIDGRPIDVLLTGNLREDIYPLRERFRRMIATERMPGVTHIHPHPGYRCRDLVECREAVADYATTLGRAEIALVCSSVYRYALAKYVEAAMAGCLVVGDMPAGAPLGYERMVEPVNVRESDEEIISRIAALLADPERLDARRRMAQQVALDQFSTARYARDFLQAII